MDIRLIAAVALVSLTATVAGAAPLQLTDSIRSRADAGTALSVDVSASETRCVDADGGVVEFDARLQTTGAVDSTEVVLRIGGGDAVSVGTLEPADFEHDGRIKTADFSTALSLENGKHDVSLCFVQSGSKGRPAKQVCASVRIVVGCAPPPACLDDAMFFGNVDRNPQLCGGNGPPHVPIHFRGALYDTVTVSIEGPDGFGLSLPMRKSGASCNHQALWDTRDGHAGVGVYTFTAAVGDEVLASLTRELTCAR